MPTNILRNRGAGTALEPRAGAGGPRSGARVRRVLIKAGRIALGAELLNTPTADRIWKALPLHSTAETWGASLHFETFVESGREPDARSVCQRGDICFWSEDDRIIIVFGPTPISRGEEWRLPRPCNVWAKSQHDVALLKRVVPGEKVTVTVA